MLRWRTRKQSNCWDTRRGGGKKKTKKNKRVGKRNNKMFGETGKDKEAVGVRVRVVAQMEKKKKVLFTWVLLTGRTRKSVWGGEVSLAL